MLNRDLSALKERMVWKSGETKPGSRNSRCKGPEVGMNLGHGSEGK